MGSKSKSKSESSSGSGQKWAQPYAVSGANTVNSVFNQAQPGLSQLTSLTQNSLIPALNDKFKSSMQGAGEANTYWRNLMNGGSTNPYLQGVVNASNDRISDDVNGMFAQSGRYGSGAWAGNLGRALSENANNLYYQDYFNQMQRQDAAANSLSQANNADAGQLLGSIGLGAEIPYTGSNALANQLGALFSGGTEKSSSKQGGGFGAALLNAAASAAVAACDERLKENVVLHHVDPDGLVFYNFTYKEGLGLPYGVQKSLPMAQDVEKLRPWAMGPEIGGYKTIVPALL